MDRRPGGRDSAGPPSPPLHEREVRPDDLGRITDASDPPGVDEDGTVALEDPWLGCPACSEEWQSFGVRYVMAENPPLEGPELDAFAEAFVAALKAAEGKPRA